MNQTNGTIFIGKKNDGTRFTEQELNLLSILINQANFAIEHASLYEVQTERLKRCIVPTAWQPSANWLPVQRMKYETR